MSQIPKVVRVVRLFMPSREYGMYALVLKVVRVVRLFTGECDRESLIAEKRINNPNNLWTPREQQEINNLSKGCLCIKNPDSWNRCSFGGLSFWAVAL